MKDFQIFRYLKQFKYLIAIGSVLAGFMFYYVASNRMQSYTASTVIEYTNTGASEGLAPDGSKIDTSEIYGSYIIAKVIQNLGIDPSTANMDDIRNSITITSIITDEQQQIFDAKVTQGEDASLIATRYMVTFNSGVASGKDYPRAMLNEILDVYSAYYGETHVNSARSPNGVNDIYDKGYDYIEMMDVIDESLTATLQTLNGKISGDSTFRSSVTGYSFSDLYREYELLQNIEVPKITAQILAGKITKNRDILLAKYRNRNNDLSIENSASEQEVEKIMGVIDSYVQMMSDSGNTNITSEYILSDIYDDTQGGLYSKTDQTTSYDKLFIRYVQDRTGYTANEIDAAEKILREIKPKGMIFLGGSVTNFQNGFANISVPSVLATLVSNELDFPNLSMVGVDDRAAAKAAVSHLIAQGHRKIAARPPAFPAGCAVWVRRMPWRTQGLSLTINSMACATTISSPPTTP